MLIKNRFAELEHNLHGWCILYLTYASMEINLHKWSKKISLLHISRNSTNACTTCRQVSKEICKCKTTSTKSSYTCLLRCFICNKLWCIIPARIHSCSGSQIWQSQHCALQKSQMPKSNKISSWCRDLCISKKDLEKMLSRKIPLQMLTDSRSLLM